MWTSTHQFTRFCFTIDKFTWGFIEISMSVIAACAFHVKQYTVITTFKSIAISSRGGGGDRGSSRCSLF